MILRRAARPPYDACSKRRPPLADSPPRRRADARAPAAGRRSATTRPTPRCCSRRCSRRRRARSPSGSATRCSGRLGERARARRGRRPRLPEPVPRPTRWYADALGARARRRRGLRRRRRAGAEQVNVEFVSANPTGPMHVGHARNAAYGDALRAHARVPRPRRHARVLRQRLRLPGRALRRVDRARGRAARRCPRTATRATTSPSSRRDRRRGDAGRSTSSARAAVALMLERMRGVARALRVGSSTSGSPSARCTRASRAPVAAHASTCLAEHGHTYRTRARCGCARPSSATTRTACSSAPPASTRTSPRDIAYHQDKRERGFDRLIDVWGADHHGYVAADEGGVRRRSAATRTSSSC